MKIFEKERCRISQGELIEVFDLGSLPFSTFPTSQEPNPEPLPLKLCLNSTSGLIQLKHSVDPEMMYRQYWYMSGINQSMRQALRSIVEQAIKRTAPLQQGDAVLDIACNDGTLLSAYPPSIFRVGIDPAKNIRPQSCDLHINDFFSVAAYKEKMGEKKAKIITSIAMFYDLEDPITFSRDVQAILQPQGLWIIELSYLPEMLKQNSFDTICSEHLEYYSLYSMEYILRQANLAVEDVELNDVNGGSFRLYIRHQGEAKETDAVKIMRQEETAMRLTDPATYQGFASRVMQNKQEMVDFLTKQKKEGKKVIGYGASTKGNTIMAYYGIGPELVSFVADRNPIKWGRQTVTRIPIISEEEARSMKPDYFLAFPYHFMKEFVARESAFLQSGGRFIAPIPRLTLISS